MSVAARVYYTYMNRLNKQLRRIKEFRTFDVLNRPSGIRVFRIPRAEFSKKGDIIKTEIGVCREREVLYPLYY